MAERIKVMLVEDNQLFRMGLSVVIKNCPDLHLISTAAHGKDALIKYREYPVDVVITDLVMPIMNGIELCRVLRELNSNIKILAVTGDEDEKRLLEVVHAGAMGFVKKTVVAEEVTAAVKSIYNNNVYFSPEIFQKLVTNLKQPISKLSVANINHSLTTREMEILKCIAEEMTNKEIAGMLYISPRTVDTHRRNLLQKLNARNTAGLVRYYVSMVG